MPYPSEHAARIKNPSLFQPDSFRRKVIAKGITIIVGKLKDEDSLSTQAYRFDIEYFTAFQAKKWLKDNNIEYLSFEPATGEKQSKEKEISEYVESREYTFSKIRKEERSSDEFPLGQIFVAGSGIVYNQEIEIYPGIYERISPGAFSESLNRFEEIKSFFNHDPDYILSTTRSSPPLEIYDSEIDMQFISPIPPTSYGKDLAINLERGNVRGASFSFSISENGERYQYDESGNIHREISKAEIFEIGPVTNPAYNQTSVDLRSRERFDQLRSELKSSKSIKDDRELLQIQSFLFQRKDV